MTTYNAINQSTTIIGTKNYFRPYNVVLNEIPKYNFLEDIYLADLKNYTFIPIIVFIQQFKAVKYDNISNTYNFIFVTPLYIEEPNLLETKEYKINIYNKYFQNIQILNINIVNSEGIEITNMPDFPYLLWEQGKLTLNLKILKEGPPSNTSYININFNNGYTAVIIVSVMRIKTWYFDHNWKNNFNIEYQYKTKITSNKYFKEFREQLLEEPNIKINYELDSVEDQESRELNNFIINNHKYKIAFPYFSEKMLCDEIISGTTEIKILDPTTIGNLYYLINLANYILIKENYKNYEIKQINNIDISNNKIIINTKTNNNYPKYSKIYPLILCRIEDFNFNIINESYIKANINLIKEMEEI